MSSEEKEKKKKEKEETPFLLQEMERIIERSLEAAFFQAMATVEKEWIKNGGTVSK